MEAARIEAGFNRAVSDRGIYRPDRLEQEGKENPQPEERDYEPHWAVNVAGARNEAVPCLVCVCVLIMCVCVCVCIYTHIHTYALARARAHTHTHACSIYDVCTYAYMIYMHYAWS